MKVLCIGQAVADVIMKPIEELDFSIDTQPIDYIGLKPGGGALNTASALAKLGNNVSFAGKLGDDEFGDFLMRHMSKLGIDVSHVKIEKKGVTAACLAAINQKGDRIFYACGGTNETLGIDDIDMSVVDSCDIVYIGGGFSLFKFDGKDAAQLLKYAKDRGKVTAMDVTYDVTGRWYQTISLCLPHLDYFMPSINEAKNIAKKENPQEIAEFLLGEGVKNVVIKLGKDGACFKNADESFHLPAQDVKVVDTTGAGDCFVGGFLTGIIKGWNYKESMKLATATSAKCIQHTGATEGLIRETCTIAHTL